MKHLLLTSFFPPPMEGGSAVYLHRLFSHLPPEQVVVYANSRPGDAAFDASQPYRTVRTGRPFEDLGVLGQIRAIFAWSLAAARLVRREGVSLVHAGHVYVDGVAALAVKLLTATPYVVFLYAEELTLALQRRDLKGRAKRWLYGRVIRAAAGVVVVSDFTGRLAMEFGARPERTLKIIPPVEAVEGSGGRPSCLEPVPAKARIVLSVGRLIPRKGLDVLVESWPAVLAEVPEAFLVVVGRGPEAGRLREMADALGPGGRVLLAGFIPDEELPRLYAQCELFVLPHRETEEGDTEGCGTVFMEAGAFGKAVVAGAAGGVTDAVVDGETGIIVDGTVSAGVAAAIVTLLKDRALAARMGEAGRRRALEKLAPPVAAHALASFCRGIVTGNGTPEEPPAHDRTAEIGNVGAASSVGAPGGQGEGDRQ